LWIYSRPSDCLVTTLLTHPKAAKDNTRENASKVSLHTGIITSLDIKFTQLNQRQIALVLCWMYMKTNSFSTMLDVYVDPSLVQLITMLLATKAWICILKIQRTRFSVMPVEKLAV
jgi:hypothetical protein